MQRPKTHKTDKRIKLKEKLKIKHEKSPWFLLNNVQPRKTSGHFSRQPFHKRHSYNSITEEVELIKILRIVSLTYINQTGRWYHYEKESQQEQLFINPHTLCSSFFRGLIIKI